MKLIVGLGNPGKKYLFNRHNVGFMVLDKISMIIGANRWENSKKLKSQLIVHNSSFVLAKPQTFMNDSGQAVAKLKNFYDVNTKDTYLIHDDLDIQLGEYKIHQAKGPKEHKGVLSVEKELGDDNFWRIRIGVDNRDNDNRISGEDYVLMDFDDEEMLIIKEALGEVAHRLISLVEEDH